MRNSRLIGMTAALVVLAGCGNRDLILQSVTGSIGHNHLLYSGGVKDGFINTHPAFIAVMSANFTTAFMNFP